MSYSESITIKIMQIITAKIWCHPLFEFGNPETAKAIAQNSERDIKIIINSFENELKQLRKENEELRKQLEWQDISTAPRDGTEIDLANFSKNQKGCAAYFSNGVFVTTEAELDNQPMPIEVYIGCPPTHWRARPKQPTSEVK